MHALSRYQLEGASLESVVEAAVQHHFGEGYGPWTRADARAYMSAQRRKTIGGFLGEMLGEEAAIWLGLGALLSVSALMWTCSLYVPFSLTLYWLMAVPLGAAAVVFSWRGLWMLFDGTYWQTNSVHADGSYPREYRAYLLPPQVRGVQATLKSMLDHPGFAVSFIGRDPVLWVFYNGMRVPAVIWDELPDGGISIVPTPRR